MLPGSFISVLIYFFTFMQFTSYDMCHQIELKFVVFLYNNLGVSHPDAETTERGAVFFRMTTVNLY